MPNGPTLGPTSPSHNDAATNELGEGPWPQIGAVDTLVLPDPWLGRGAPSHAPEAEQHTGGGSVYIHGGGFTYGTLDEFEVPMRLIAERAGMLTYVIEYQLAPEAKFPTQIEEIEYSSAGCSSTPESKAWTRTRSASAGTPLAAT